MQAKVERITTPEARLALYDALGQAGEPLDFAQLRRGRAVNNSDTTTALPTYAAKVVTVFENHNQWASGKRVSMGQQTAGSCTISCPWSGACSEMVLTS